MITAEGLSAQPVEFISNREPSPGFSQGITGRTDSFGYGSLQGAGVHGSTGSPAPASLTPHLTAKAGPDTVAGKSKPAIQQNSSRTQSFGHGSIEALPEKILGSGGGEAAGAGEVADIAELALAA
jgi:hypothetical protein